MIESRKFQQAISYHYDVYNPKLDESDLNQSDLRDAVKPKPLLLCQHGYGQNKTIAMRFGQNIRRDWPIIAQQGPHKHHKIKDGKFDTGFSWVSSFEAQEDVENHHNFIIHSFDEALQNRLTKHEKVYLFGFSQSVSLIFRFASKYPDLVAGVIAVAGAAPTDWAIGGEARLPMPVLYICPIEDQSYTYERMMHFKAVLAYHTKQLDWQEFEGGHRVPSRSYAVMKEWLDKQEIGKAI